VKNKKGRLKSCEGAYLHYRPTGSLKKGKSVKKNIHQSSESGATIEGKRKGGLEKNSFRGGEHEQHVKGVKITTGKMLVPKTTENDGNQSRMKK